MIGRSPRAASPVILIWTTNAKTLKSIIRNIEDNDIRASCPDYWISTAKEPIDDRTSSSTLQRLSSEEGAGCVVADGEDGQDVDDHMKFSLFNPIGQATLDYSLREFDPRAYEKGDFIQSNRCI